MAACSLGAVELQANGTFRCSGKLRQALNASWTTAAAHVAAEQGNCVAANAERLVCAAVVSHLTAAGVPERGRSTLAGKIADALLDLPVRAVTPEAVTHLIRQHSGLVRTQLQDVAHFGLPTTLPPNVAAGITVRQLILKYPNAMLPALRPLRARLGGRPPKLHPQPSPAAAARAYVHAPLSVLVILFDLQAAVAKALTAKEDALRQRLRLTLRNDAAARELWARTTRAALLKKNDPALVHDFLCRAVESLARDGELPADVNAVLLPSRSGKRESGSSHDSIPVTHCQFVSLKEPTAFVGFSKSRSPTTSSRSWRKRPFCWRTFSRRGCARG